MGVTLKPQRRGQGSPRSSNNINFLSDTHPEGYASKQCGHCGCINDGLGSSKIFTCPSYELVAGRDVYAARSVLLKLVEPFIKKQRKVY